MAAWPPKPSNPPRLRLSVQEHGEGGALGKQEVVLARDKVLVNLVGVTAPKHALDIDVVEGRVNVGVALARPDLVQQVRIGGVVLQLV